VFLVAAGGTEARVELVAINAPKQVLFIMPTDATGVYHVRVHRRRLRPTQPQPTQFMYDTVLEPA
jgi:hypothetical protein